MSIECSECEADMRGGHAPGCSHDKQCPRCGQMMSAHDYHDEEADYPGCPRAQQAPEPVRSEPPRAEPPCTCQAPGLFWDEDCPRDGADSRPSAPAPSGEPPEIA